MLKWQLDDPADGALLTAQEERSHGFLFHILDI